MNKKIFKVLIGSSVSFLFLLPNTIAAVTVQELLAQLTHIQAQVVAMQNSRGQSATFTQNLTIGSTGQEVVALQQILVNHKYLIMPAGVSYGYFGGLTQTALAKWQSANGVSPAVGYWGPISRNKYMSIAPATNTLSSNVSSSVSSGGGGGSSSPSGNSQSQSVVSVSNSNQSSPSSSGSSSSSGSINQSNSSISSQQSVVISSPPVSTNSSSMEWGAFIGYSASELSSFEQLVGKPVDIRAVFVNWNASFPTSFASNLKSSGKKLLIFWEQYDVSLDSIIAGNSDTYIRNFAAAANAYGGEVILAPLHEMNGNWDPWGGAVGSNTPAKVVATWKKIHDVFGDVPNVKFAWSVNNISVPNTPSNAIAHYYPGDSYIDYVGVDGFNFGSPWQSFDQIFDSVLKELSGYGKPIYILSTASAQGPQKASWITDFGNKVENYPLLMGWVWFNENKEKDWRVNSDNSALSAFKAILP